MARLSVTEYCRKYGVARKTVYRWIERNKLSAKKEGGQFFIDDTGTPPAVQPRPAPEPSYTPPPPPPPAPDTSAAVLEVKVEYLEKILKLREEQIQELKAANREIVETLRSEVELLKDAFGEMKRLYQERKEEEKARPVAPTPSPRRPAAHPPVHGEGWLTMEEFMGIMKMRGKDEDRIKEIVIAGLITEDRRFRFDGREITIAYDPFADLW